MKIMLILHGKATMLQYQCTVLRVGHWNYLGAGNDFQKNSWIADSVSHQQCVGEVHQNRLSVPSLLYMTGQMEDVSHRCSAALRSGDWKVIAYDSHHFYAH